MPTPNSSHIKWTVTIIRSLSVIYEYNATNFSGGTIGKKKKKKLLANTGDIRDTGLMPGSGRYPGEGNGSPLQYSCLGNPMDQRT